MRKEIEKFAQDILDEGEFSYDQYHDEEVDSDTYGERVEWALNNYQEDEEAKAWLEANDLWYLVEDQERHEETSTHANQFLPVFQARSAELLDMVFSEVRLEVPDAMLGDVGDDRAGVSNVERSFEGAWDLRNVITIVSPANDSYTIPVVELWGAVGVLNLNSISGLINNTVAKGDRISSEEEVNRLFDNIDPENYEKVINYFVEQLSTPNESNRLSDSSIDY